MTSVTSMDRAHYNLCHRRTEYKQTEKTLQILFAVGGPECEL